VGPSEPSRPPPNIRNVGSLTGWVLPSAIRKAAPRNDMRPPSVTTNDGTPRYATSEPWYSAITSDTASPARQAGAQCQPLLYIRKAIKTPTTPSTEPTERSIWRATIISATPAATMPTTAVCCAML
jgi:hypothetical protein